MLSSTLPCGQQNTRLVRIVWKLIKSEVLDDGFFLFLTCSFAADNSRKRGWSLTEDAVEWDDHAKVNFDSSGWMSCHGSSELTRNSRKPCICLSPNPYASIWLGNELFPCSFVSMFDVQGNDGWVFQYVLKLHTKHKTDESSPLVLTWTK